MKRKMSYRRICNSSLLICTVAACLVAQYAAVGAPPKSTSAANRQKPQPRRDVLAIPDVSKDKLICFALYTVQDDVLKLTAQLYPLADDDSRTVRLEIKKNGQWQPIAKTQVIEDGWTAIFRVENWDCSRDAEYRVAHGNGAVYTGTIRKDPVDKDEIVVAAFTGNSINQAHGGDIPRADIIDNVKRIDADLLFFSGDQVYDHNRHYAAWLKFGRDFGEIIKDRPTITIPDDHDVGQPNLWGEEGTKSTLPGAADGGYARPVEYVKMVERAQTSHLPDPFDPRPIKRGIGVYFTDMTVGGISFAIIEDRKFKTGPAGIIPKQGPRPDHINNPDYDPKSIDVPEAQLLGGRQLKFLRQWGADWHDCEMKAVLSQTIFCGGAHIHGKIGGRLHADLDSNGWPQTGRNKALAEIRKAFAVHLAGDQHLGTIFHHGIEDWGDACYSFCVPSIANLYLRWWAPIEPGENRDPGMPDYTGRHLDGLGNKVTCYAAANPVMKAGDMKNGKLSTRAAGFGVVRFSKPSRTITFECWPRNVDITDPKAKQYPGWPLTIQQQDNYGRQAVAWLPTIEVTGAEDPVVQIIDEADGEIVYTLRIKGTTFRPKVFKPGKYAIKTISGNVTDEMRGIDSIGTDEAKTLEVKF